MKSDWFYHKIVLCGINPIHSDLTRFNNIAIPNNKFQMASGQGIGLSRVQQFSHLCVARPYQISVNSIFKFIHTTSINTIINLHCSLTNAALFPLVLLPSLSLKNIFLSTSS